MTSTSLAPRTDRTTPARKPRPRTMKVHGISIEVDETATHWLIYVSPSVDLAARGIGPHRSRLAKCDGRSRHMAVAQSAVAAKGGRCRCGAWNVYGIGIYVGKLLRSYPKLTVQVDR